MHNRSNFKNKRSLNTLYDNNHKLSVADPSCPPPHPTWPCKSKS